MKTAHPVAFPALLGLAAILLTADPASAGNVHGCAADEPCFTSAYQSWNSVVFEFAGVSGWDFYNVRYAQKGGGQKQVENRSGRFTLTNVQGNRVYTLHVQGCRSRPMRRAVCSPWVSESVTTR